MTDTIQLKTILMRNGYEYAVKALIELLKVSPPSASNKIRNITPFTQEELATLYNKLDMTPDEFLSTFLGVK